MSCHHHNAVFVAFDGVQALDLIGPADVLQIANEIADSRARDRHRYRTTIISPGGRSVCSSSGIGISAAAGLDINPATIDTLFVPGGERDALRRLRDDTQVLSLVQETLAADRRIAAICTGAELLAAAGVIGDGTLATHWRAAPRLRREFPDLQFSDTEVFRGAGRVYSSAGITSGIDLALHLVEQDMGRMVALEATRMLVLSHRRHGSHAQRSEMLRLQESARRFDLLLQFLSDAVGTELSVTRLAELCHMSPRNFRRRLAEELGQTPRELIASTRLQWARQLLEEAPTAPLQRIARQCGYPSASAMRRSFVQQLGCTPSDYRNRRG